MSSALAVICKLVGADLPVAVLRYEERVTVQGDAGRRGKAGGEDTPFHVGNLAVLCQLRVHLRARTHDVRRRGGGVVGVDPENPASPGVGDVEDSIRLVEYHVARDAYAACGGDLGVASNDTVVVVVSAGIVVVVEVVIHQFTVVAVVVPVGIARVVGDAHPVRTLMQHVEVTTQGSAWLLVLHGEVGERRRPECRPHEIVRRLLAVVRVAGFLCRGEDVVELGMVLSEGERADLLHEVVAVCVLPVLARLAC